MIKNLKEKIIGASGSISGVASIFGSWQVCHNICLAIIALLGIIGITVVGMPLLFLTKIAIPLWTIALILLLITIAIYLKKKCISNRLIMFNSGLIIAGIPFAPLQEFSLLFWILGGILAALGIALYIKDKIQRKGLNMKKSNTRIKTILFILLLGLIFIIGCTSNNSENIGSYSNNALYPNDVTSLKTIASGSTQNGDVLIELTPRNNNGKLEVDIAINTHSVNLDQFDLKKITTLEYNEKVLKPIFAPSLSGHHSLGKLVFDVGEEINKFKITIKGIPKIENRVFTFL